MPVSLRLPLIGLLLLTICHPGVCQDVAASLDVTAARAMSAPEEPSALALSFYGRYLAAGLRDGRLWLWDTASSEEPRVIRAHASRINAAQFSPNGSLLATVADDGQAAVWDTRSLQRVDRFPQERAGKAQTADFSSNGQAVAVGYDSGVVAVFSLSSQRLVRRFQDHKGRILAVAFRYLDDNTLFTIGADRRRYRYNLADGQGVSLELRTSRESKDAQLRSAAVAGEGKIIAITAKATHIVGNYADIQEQHYIKLVDRETGEQSAVGDSFRSVPRNPNASIALSADGRMLAATGQTQRQETRVRVWDLKNPLAPADLTLPRPVRYLAFGRGRGGLQLAIAAGREIYLYPIRFEGPGVPAETLAVMNLESEERELGLSLSEVIRSEVSRLNAFVLISRNNVQEILGEELLASSGLTKESPQIQLLAMQKFIKGRLQKQGEQYLLSLSLTDVKTGRSVEVRSEATSRAEIEAAARSLTADLIQKSSRVASVP